MAGEHSKHMRSESETFLDSFLFYLLESNMLLIEYLRSHAVAQLRKNFAFNLNFTQHSSLLEIPLNKTLSFSEISNTGLYVIMFGRILIRLSKVMFSSTC